MFVSTACVRRARAGGPARWSVSDSACTTYHRQLNPRGACRGAGGRRQDSHTGTSPAVPFCPPSKSCAVTHTACVTEIRGTAAHRQIRDTNRRESLSRAPHTALASSAPGKTRRALSRLSRVDRAPLCVPVPPSLSLSRRTRHAPARPNAQSPALHTNLSPLSQVSLSIVVAASAKRRAAQGASRRRHAAGGGATACRPHLAALSLACLPRRGKRRPPKDQTRTQTRTAPATRTPPRT